MNSSNVQKEIFEAEVWVTPYSRMYLVKSYDVVPFLNFIPDTSSQAKYRYVPDQTMSRNNGVFISQKDGQALVKAIQDHGHFVRIKEVAAPRWGESVWMLTNGIEEVA